MSVVQEALVAEIQDRIKVSVNYKQQIDTAKTKIKRKILTKKLHKNNKIVANLMESLEKINKNLESTNA